MASRTSFRKLSNRKKLLFLFCAAVLGLTLQEGLSWCAIQYLEQTYQVSTHNVQKELVRSSTTRSSEAESIHPYLGWVLNPQLNTGTTLFDRTIPVNSQGFNDVEHGVLKRAPDRFIVGITGGSVAWQMSVAGEETLRRELAQHSRIQGKKIEIVRLAMAGYKQPQQLLSLTYALALGNEFDMIINVDGYNEIALGVVENYPPRIFPAYPRLWHARMQHAVDPQNYATAFRLLQLRGLKQQVARGRLESWLPWSPTLNLIWWVRNKALEGKILQLAAELQDQKNSKGLGFAALGPKPQYTNESELYAQLVSLWSETSLQMHRLCGANHCLYLHFLQPNQYLPNSKPMGAYEREKMFSDTQEYGISIAQGYPLLMKEGQKLRLKEVHFHDVTDIFSQIEDVIYADGYCHFNERGNVLLAQAVAKQVLAMLDQQK
ncbi:MAG: hypothetical protein V4719_02545 [Planctomycetota bacterium]